VKATVKVYAGLSLFAAVLVGASQPALAQDLPKMDVSIGYQGAKSGDIDVDASPQSPAQTFAGNYKYGFNADGSVPLNRTFSALAELGWIRNSVEEDPAASHANFNAVNYGGGLRWNSRRSDGSTGLFAQVVLGIQRDTFDVGSGPALGRFINQGYVENSFQVQPGVGFVFPMNETIGVLVQADYRQVFSDKKQSMIRYVFGLRFNQR